MSNSSPTPVTIVDRPSASGLGLTLIEILVVIAVVAVLLAISLPALSSSRAAGRRLTCESNVRSSVQAISAYTNDFGGMFPSIADPKSGFVAGNITLDYFTQIGCWPIALKSYIGAEAAMSSTQFCPTLYRYNSADDLSAQPWVRWQSSYWQTLGAIVGPESFVDPVPEIISPTSLRTMRFADVLFPSQKGILAEKLPWHEFAKLKEFTPDMLLGKPGFERHTFSTAFADGSALALRGADMIPAVKGPFGAYYGPVIATVDGIRGRDRK